VVVDGAPSRVDNIEDALEIMKGCICEDDGWRVTYDTVRPYNARQAGAQGEEESLVDRECGGGLGVRVVDCQVEVSHATIDNI